MDKKKSKLKIVVGAATYFIILGAMIYFAPKVLMYALDSQYPMASIASGSMWPVLKRGDLVFIEGVGGKDSVKVGDIVVYRSDRGFTIHRLIEKNEDSAITKGDANEIADHPVEYTDIVGKALVYNGKPVRVPYLGSLSLFLNGI